MKLIPSDPLTDVYRRRLTYKPRCWHKNWKFLSTVQRTLFDKFSNLPFLFSVKNTGCVIEPQYLANIGTFCVNTAVYTRVVYDRRQCFLHSRRVVPGVISCALNKLCLWTNVSSLLTTLLWLSWYFFVKMTRLHWSSLITSRKVAWS